jgi:peptide-methionine (S)-S-oxide reductase
MKATFGAGCFWHIEEEFRKLEGIQKTAVGFMGGQTKNPSYNQVCKGTTGHIEVCQLDYDPQIIPYHKLLATFWAIHDPTQKNRQGPDIGEQYQSVIFYHSPEQRIQAVESKNSQQKKHKKPLATHIKPAEEFFKAEDYHQKYLAKKGLNTCP